MHMGERQEEAMMTHKGRTFAVRACRNRSSKEKQKQEEKDMNTGALIGFVLWLAGGCLLVALGIRAFFAKKEVGFFSNVKALNMRDVKAYNRAVGKLFIVYGIVFMALGLPLLAGQNSGLILISILGTVAETIGAMAVYILVIQNKYERK